MLGKLSVPGRPPSLNKSRAMAYCACVGAGGVVWTFCLPSILFSFSLAGRQIESIIGLRCRPEGKRIMPETRFTEFPALFVDTSVGISSSASETDDILFSYLLLNKIVLFP